VRPLLLLILLNSLFTISLFSQPFSVKKKIADRYYKRYDYPNAVRMYSELLEQQPFNMDIIEKMAIANLRLNDAKQAEFWLSKLVDSANVKPELVLAYAQMQARNGDYQKSKEWYAKYAQLIPIDKRGLAFENAYSDMTGFYKDSTNFATRALPFNSVFSDFSPAYYKNGLVFSSDRRNRKIVRLTYAWTQRAYLDLFYAYPDSANATSFLNDLGSIYHEGPVTFNKTQDTMYFTRSNVKNLMLKKTKEKINKLEIFQAVWDTAKKEWGNIKPLAFNNRQYSFGHPALSNDGKTMYLVSDMPDSRGGTDIYYSESKIDSLGKPYWSTPRNMGDTINTAGNEMFPYVDKDGNLYFASNGLPGLGGLDIFMSKKGDKGFEPPVNLGNPINTRFDDFGYIIGPSGKEGYLSSDRFNEPGNDDILKWKKISRNLILQVLDKATRKPLPNSAINIAASGIDPITRSVDENGSNLLVVQPSKDYSFKVSKDKYVDSLYMLNKQQLAELDTLKLLIAKRIPKFDLVGRVYSEDNKAPFADATATLINLADSSKITTTTDSFGMFKFRLSPEADYRIAIAITAAGKKCGTNAVDRSTKGLDYDNTFNELFPVFCVGDVIKIENIYYDLGKWNIRADAGKELDKVLDLMAKYPKMKIELRSHTDSRGSDAANLSLSDKRAKAAVEYLISKGANKDNITGKGYGESMPINRCTNGVKCKEEEYQVNRRTEFQILSIE
jgi:outer membrane protein OmpA-like peptidoglycan-associated protein/tetratricopeptide (TPR) repeat protein